MKNKQNDIKNVKKVEYANVQLSIENINYIKSVGSFAKVIKVIK